MKKIILFLILLYSINSVNAITNLPNNNSTNSTIYTNLDLNYNLDISDSLSKFYINYDIKANTKTDLYFTFKDKNNNTLIIKYSYSYEKDWLFDNIILYITATYNNQLLTFPKSNAFKLLDENYIYQSWNNYNIFNAYDNFDTTIKFSPSEITINQFYSIIPSNFYINQIQLQNYSNYNNIKLEYQDNGIAIIKNQIDTGYNNLNPVFKLIFSLIEGIFKFLNFLSVIDNNTLYDYQITVLTPLTFLDYFISFILFVLQWIFTMGILWTFSIATMFIFIISYLKSSDLMDCMFNIFPHNEINFLKITVINPVIWIYSKIVLFWSGK